VAWLTNQRAVSSAMIRCSISSEYLHWPFRKWILRSIYIAEFFDIVLTVELKPPADFVCRGLTDSFACYVA